MAQRGRPAKAKALEGELLKAWDGKTLKAKASRGLELASIRAVERITRLIDSENEQVALAASREVLARNFGLPKATVDVAVSDTSAAHHAALRAIYDKALARAGEKPLINPDATDAIVVTQEPLQLESDSATAQIEQAENEPGT